MEDKAITDRGPSPWDPETNPRRIAVLGKLGEELGEASSAAMRALIQGIGEREPVTGKPNLTWFEDELADVLATVSLAGEEFDVDMDRVLERAEKKRAYLTAWFDNLGPSPDSRARRQRIFGTPKVG